MPHLADARSVTAVVCTGSHARLTEGNRQIVSTFEQVAAAEGVAAETLIHDCHDDAGLTKLGTTSRGTPVAANARALDCDVFLVASGMKNHYFAGYSNALKAFLPGVCSYDGIEANHAMALDDSSTFGTHPLHPEPDRRTNPLADDMLEAARMIVGDRDVFMLATVTAGGRSLWAGAGDMEAVVAEGIRHVDRAASKRVRPHSRLVVSPGGHPDDETLYNAQRGLELARNAMTEGAEVLFLAACPGGTAPTADARENFFERLTAPLDDVLRGLEEQYVLYSHKAYKFAVMLKRLRAIHVLTEMEEDTVAAAHMRKVDSPQAVLDRWQEESDEDILIVEDANRLAIYAS
jgi:nickel-dependent lactate racemase